MNEPLAILLCDDLLFASRIEGTARAAGLALRTVRSVAEVEANAKHASCVILDLALAGPTIATLAAALRQGSRPFIVAYGSHVDAATLHAARDAGCDVVLPRSKFVEALPMELHHWASGASS